jgi:putative heme degradation protein
MMSVVHSRIPQGWRASIEGTAFANHPLFTPTIRASARIVGERALIPLLPRWAVLFHGVKTFGRVIRYCRNRCAAACTEGAYPEVLTTPCGRNACGGEGELKFFFPHWARAFASVERRARDWAYAVEFYDFRGDPIHKVFLTPESDLEAFRWWVGLNHAADLAVRQVRGLRSPPRIEGPGALCEADARLLSKQSFRRFLRRLIEAELPIRISVGNEGLVQTVRVTPDRLQEDAQSIYLGGERTGVQLRKDWLAEVSLHRSCSSFGWILKAHESEGFVACAIEPARGEDAELWDGWLMALKQSRSHEAGE